jgi:hypothetical protein
MGQKLIKRADGSYSKRGLWDNIRANRGSGKKPTSEMLEQEAKIKSENKMGGLKNKTMNLKKKKMKDGGKFGMLSVKAGYDNNPNATAADRIVGAKKSKNKMGGKKKMYGGSAMKPKKKGMGGKMMKYKTGGFTLEPKTPNLDEL